MKPKLKAFRCDSPVTSVDCKKLQQNVGGHACFVFWHCGKRFAVVVKWGNPLELLQRTLKPLWLAMPSSKAACLRNWSLSRQKKNQFFCPRSRHFKWKCIHLLNAGWIGDPCFSKRYSTHHNIQLWCCMAWFNIRDGSFSCCLKNLKSLYHMLSHGINSKTSHFPISFPPLFFFLLMGLFIYSMQHSGSTFMSYI